MSIEQYHEEQVRVQGRYNELIRDYEDLPRGVKPKAPLAHELDQLEMVMLDNPPTYWVLDEDGNETDELSVRQKGLRFPNEKETEFARTLQPMSDFEVVDPSLWPSLVASPDACDLSSLIHHKLDQDGVGSCGFESLVNGMHASAAFATDTIPDLLNPLFGYNTTSGGRDQGSSLPSNIEFALKYGCATEAVWPRSKGWKAKPSQAAYADAKKHKLIIVYQIRNWVEFASSLLYGWPVYFGYSGHAILAVKLMADLNRVKYINSWSESWGDKGFGTISKDRIYWGYGVYAIRTVTYQGG